MENVGRGWGDGGKQENGRVASPEIVPIHLNWEWIFLFAIKAYVVAS